MPTRREILFDIAAAAPLAGYVLGHPLVPLRREPEIIEEPHCLSQESAKGFRLLLSRNQQALSPKLMIAPGNRKLSREAALRLLHRVTAGKWLILESGLPFMAREEALGQLKLLRDVFGFRVHAPLAVEDAYIEYTWPLRRLVRHFSMIAPIECSRSESIAERWGVPVCEKRFIGSGGVIFLGSMLGPGLLAEEREAHEVGAGLLRETAFRS